MNPATSLWYGVDPLAEKYVTMGGYIYTLDNPIRLIDPEGLAPKDPPTVKQTLEYGINHSRTFKKLMSIAGITLGNYNKYISFGSSTDTDPIFGKITLTKGNDKKYQVIKLAHELSNRINRKVLQKYGEMVEEAKISPRKYALLTAQKEVDGEINQIKVAAEINFRYPGSKYKTLNQVIDYYSKNRNMNLRRIVEPSAQHISTYTITEDLFEEYRFYLKKRGLATATMNRYLCWLSRLMYRAVSQRIIRCNPFENAKYEKAEQKIRFLQKSEVSKLMALRVLDKEAEQARRMFIFSCFTGLAIADMEHLQFGHIQTAADGQKYIRKERQKTKVEFIVPLHPIAEAIINQCKEEQPSMKEMQTVKDKDNSFIFRTNYSRSVMSAKLSIVGKACGIRERLSYHMARHTFGTMSLSAGIPIESIAKMMGHASISSTQIYAQVTDNKISEDMDRLIRKHQTKETKEEVV